jgi:flagellar motor switch protein FliG
VELVELLEKLRTKVTANEIKLMARQINDQFEFLARLDAGQVFALIRDEMPRIQSIVLTQLDGKRRQLVFDQFEGDAKLGLMKELCQGEAIPRDFLANVARAMQKKIRAKPEFDTENVRSNDILLDLLERSDFAAQVRLIADLQENNPDASRSIKKRLVTVHILKFLKEGQLLEIILGMDRNDLLIFLAGAEEDISRLLLSKAPDELAESWREDLASMSGIDGGKYRVVEMQILGRLRNMAGNGMFNLLEINELIYQADSAPIGGNGSTDLAGQIPSQPMGASRIVA